MAEDDLVRQHHQLNEHEFEQILRASEGWEARCAAIYGVVESDTT